jgi:hypothetical protein
VPNWKKVIVSGSDANLNSLEVTNTVTASFFVGDGSGLTNLPTFTSFPFTGSAEITGSLQVIGPTNLSGSLTASGLIYPIIDGTVNQAIVTDGAGNLSFDNPYSSNTVVYGKNLSGTTILKGTPLYFTGSGTSGNIVGVLPADAGNPARMPAAGVAGEELLDEAEGIVLLDGFINGVDTSAFSSGDPVYVAVGGGYTNVKPTGSTILIQALGYVERSAVNGSGVIQGSGRANDVPNIQQGYTWVGNADGVATPTPTSSFSVANAVSASFATTASYALNASSTSFPYTGSAEITGSLTVTGSIKSTTVQSNIFINNQTITDAIYVPSGSNALIIGPVGIENEVVVEDGGNLYITDFTSLSPQDLQSVTDVGSTTTNSITAANFITTSDKRLKSEIKAIKNPFKVLDNIKSYEYIKDGKKDAGFIAQEVQETIPYAVFENEEGILTMSDRPLLAYLYAAVIELKEENKKLKKELKNIKP